MINPDGSQRTITKGRKAQIGLDGFGFTYGADSYALARLPSGWGWFRFTYRSTGLGIFTPTRARCSPPGVRGSEVLFALIVRDGVRYGLILFIGVICAQSVVRGTEPLGIPATIAAATIIATVYTLAATLARYYLRINVELTRLRDILTLIATGTTGAVVVATLLTPLIIATGGFDSSDFFPAFLLGLVGDIIGIAVISPLLLRLPRLRRELTLRHLRSIALEVGFFGILILIGLCVILGTKSSHGSHFFYALFLPIITVAIRHGFDGACIGLLTTQYRLGATSPSLRLRRGRIYRVPITHVHTDSDRAHCWCHRQRA